MKKIYNMPTIKIAKVKIEAVLQDLSGSLKGTSNGGNTSDSGITGGDAKDSRGIFDYSE